jgi:carbon monoxide dehydrogenase subunit G
MALTSYHFQGGFAVPAERDLVHETLLDLERYVEWWPQVRAVARLGDDDALVVCRSALPYDLELRLHAVSREPDLLEVSVDGPFAGWVRWALRPDGAGHTGVSWRQRVTVRNPALVLGSYVARPLLRWNHARMMRGAEHGLRARLQASEASAAS